MSSPIPISTNQPTTPPDTRRVSHPTLDKLPLPAHPPGSGSAHSPSSSLSISPQTPFFPPPGAPLSPLGSSATPTQSGFIKWASGFSLGKSPVSPPLSSTRGFEIPHLQSPSQSHQHPTSASMPASAIVMDEDDHHAHERHDAFEFGDLGDMKNKSWTGATATANRRAVSMSMASGQSASGITSMLRGFGSTSAASGPGQHGEVTSPIGFSPGGGTGHNQNGTSPPASMPQGGVLADKAAKGQGLLRRFSIGGGFARSPFLSPPSGSSALPPSPPHASMSTTAPAASAPVQSAIPPPLPVHHAVDEGLKPRMTARGRRYSETGARKRGVSPMGERILRDQVHF
ncbi:hypothetical protein EHS25_002982 [Saitozyma podzolica]|uniref:Uncharacterized protein n=1 Tax=Saitozyma podzolica TaxID=1890683 RepID=A0A427YCS1_9TREE|nr:hypothetical protein EHS25_002982 [Saitozyma podzolica]